MKDDLACPMIRKLSSVYVLAHYGFAIRCCPMADSQLILELFFLQIQGGCSLAVLLFFLMLAGTCCFILFDHWASKIVFSFKCFGICLHQDSKPSLV